MVIYADIKPLLVTGLFLLLVNSGWNHPLPHYRKYLTSGRFMTMTRKACHDPFGNSGTCMFKWDCISQKGITLSTCVDGFLFGACCRLKEDSLQKFTDNPVSVSQAYNDGEQSNAISVPQDAVTDPLVYNTKASSLQNEPPLKTNSNVVLLNSTEAENKFFKEKVSSSVSFPELKTMVPTAAASTNHVGIKDIESVSSVFNRIHNDSIEYIVDDVYKFKLTTLLNDSKSKHPFEIKNSFLNAQSTLEEYVLENIKVMPEKNESYFQNSFNDDKNISNASFSFLTTKSNVELTTESENTKKRFTESTVKINSKFTYLPETGATKDNSFIDVGTEYTPSKKRTSIESNISEMLDVKEMETVEDYSLAATIHAPGENNINVAENIRLSTETGFTKHNISETETLPSTEKLELNASSISYSATAATNINKTEDKSSTNEDILQRFTQTVLSSSFQSLISQLTSNGVSSPLAINALSTTQKIYPLDVNKYHENTYSATIPTNLDYMNKLTNVSLNVNSTEISQEGVINLGNENISFFQKESLDYGPIQTESLSNDFFEDILNSTNSNLNLSRTKTEHFTTVNISDSSVTPDASSYIATDSQVLESTSLFSTESVNMTLNSLNEITELPEWNLLLDNVTKNVIVSLEEEGNVMHTSSEENDVFINKFNINFEVENFSQHEINLNDSSSYLENAQKIAAMTASGYSIAGASSFLNPDEFSNEGEDYMPDSGISSSSPPLKQFETQELFDNEKNSSPDILSDYATYSENTLDAQTSTPKNTLSDEEFNYNITVQTYDIHTNIDFLSDTIGMFSSSTQIPKDVLTENYSLSQTLDKNLNEPSQSTLYSLYSSPSAITLSLDKRPMKSPNLPNVTLNSVLAESNSEMKTFTLQFQTTPDYIISSDAHEESLSENPLTTLDTTITQDNFEDKNNVTNQTVEENKNLTSAHILEYNLAPEDSYFDAEFFKNQTEVSIFIMTNSSSSPKEPVLQRNETFSLVSSNAFEKLSSFSTVSSITLDPGTSSEASAVSSNDSTTMDSKNELNFNTLIPITSLNAAFPETTYMPMPVNVTEGPTTLSIESVLTIMSSEITSTLTTQPNENIGPILPNATHQMNYTDESTTLTSEFASELNQVSTTEIHRWNYKRDCGVRLMQPAGRIVGGQNTYFGKWPWQALVKEATWLGLFVKNKCGGVLITAKYVLTAAHCQPGFLASLLVVLGAHDLAGTNDFKTPVIRNVKRMVVHRHYNAQTFENDLALLEMESEVEFLPHVVPICLPHRNEDFTGKMAFVTGWGKLTHGGDVPNILQEVQVPIVANGDCQRMFFHAGHQKAIRSNFVCAGYTNGGQDSCEGDSGGPLMVQREDKRWVLVGTVSHGIGCADPNLPGVYMRMSSYRPWIDSIINK